MLKFAQTLVLGEGQCDTNVIQQGLDAPASTVLGLYTSGIR